MEWEPAAHDGLGAYCEVLRLLRLAQRCPRVCSSVIAAGAETVPHAGCWLLAGNAKCMHWALLRSSCCAPARVLRVVGKKSTGCERRQDSACGPASRQELTHVALLQGPVDVACVLAQLSRRVGGYALCSCELCSGLGLPVRCAAP